MGRPDKGSYREKLIATTLRKGQFYRHYGGDVYEVESISLFEEDEDTLVNYKNWDGEQFSRRLTIFTQQIVHNGRMVNRFDRISDQEALCDLQAHEAKHGKTRST